MTDTTIQTDLSEVTGQSPHPQKSAFAIEFLAMLGREQFEFRAIPETPAAKKAVKQMLRRVGAFHQLKHWLRQRNDEGYGVFVQINDADGNGFESKNIIAAPCLFADFDGAPLENLYRLALRPHMIIETSAGKFHAYWRIGDLPIDQFTALQARLIRIMESDPVVKDKARIMRLPGFLHQKDPERPHLVSIIERNDCAPYDTKTFVAALEAAEAALGQTAPAKPVAKQSITHIGEVAKSEDAIRYLIEKSAIDLGGYQDWHRVLMALKQTHGDAAWPLALQLSASAANFDGDDACRAKWDSFGKPEGAPLTMATFYKLARDQGWEDKGREAQSGGRKSQQPATAVLAKNLAEEAGDEFWLDMNGEAFATFEINHPDGTVQKINARIDSSIYKQELGSRLTETYRDKVLSAEQTKTAVGLLQHKAKSGGRHPTYLRSGEHDGAVYISLGRKDGSVIRIDSEGWCLVQDPPVKFIYSAGTKGELPIPEPGGSLVDFVRHFNLSRSDTQRLVAIMTVALMGAPSFPICLIEGEQGTGKSTLGDMVLSLVDPAAERKNGRSAFSSDERNLMIKAAHNHLLFFDNISSIDQDTADALCRLATGGSFSVRTMYTNSEETTFAAVRPVMATCIGSPTHRGDFLDRTVRVTAMRVDRYKTEAQLWHAFESDRPKLFGFLVELIQLALRNKPTVQEAIDTGTLKLPRLSDFAAVVEAAAELLGLEPGEFSRSLLSEQRNLQAESALGNPLVLAIHDYFSTRAGDSLEVTARELLIKLQSPGYEWKAMPNANQVKKVLTRNAAGIQALGLKVEVIDPKGRENVCRYRISRLPNFQPSSQDSRPKDPF